MTVGYSSQVTRLVYAHVMLVPLHDTMVVDKQSAVRELVLKDQ